MEYNELVRLWEYAFQMLYEKDIALFETDVQERSIAGRLAIYLQHKYDGGLKKMPALTWNIIEKEMILSVHTQKM